MHYCHVTVYEWTQWKVAYKVVRREYENRTKKVLHFQIFSGKHYKRTPTEQIKMKIKSLLLSFTCFCVEIYCVIKISDKNKIYKFECSVRTFHCKRAEESARERDRKREMQESICIYRQWCLRWCRCVMRSFCMYRTILFETIYLKIVYVPRAKKEEEKRLKSCGVYAVWC